MSLFEDSIIFNKSCATDTYLSTRQPTN